MQVTPDHLFKLYRYCEANAKAALLARPTFAIFSIFVDQHGDVVSFVIKRGAGPEHPTPDQEREATHAFFAKKLADGSAIAYATASYAEMPEDTPCAFRDAILVHMHAPGVQQRHTYLPFEVQPWWRLRKLLKMTLVKYYEAIVIDLSDRPR